jgi:hypothetical protein
MDGDVEGGEKPVAAWCSHAGHLDCRTGSRRCLRWPEVAMKVTCGGVAAVLEVGKEDPGGLTYTIRGRWRPAPKEAVWQLPGTSVRGNGEVNCVRRSYDPRGRRSYTAQVREGYFNQGSVGSSHWLKEECLVKLMHYPLWMLVRLEWQKHGLAWWIWTISNWFGLMGDGNYLWSSQDLI